MALNVFGSTYDISRKVLMRVAREAFLYLSEEFEVNLRFVSKAKITELNRIYRNRNLATDVLSFQLDPNVSGGDVVICYKEVLSQAKKWKVSENDAASLLLAHGILHLAGYKHTKTADRAKMEKAEETILKKGGLKVER